MRSILHALTIAALAGVLAAPAQAQDSAVPSDEIRAVLVETLPGWWRVTSFESADYVADVADEGRDPKNPVTLTSSSKPPHRGTGFEATHSFAADIELTETLFEENYSEGGATFVEELMPSGAQLHITGTYGAARDEVLQLDQAGLDTLGISLEDFEGNALLLGSPEADAFIEELEAARVNGTLSKLLNDEGDEL